MFSVWFYSVREVLSSVRDVQRLQTLIWYHKKFIKQKPQHMNNHNQKHQKPKSRKTKHKVTPPGPRTRGGRPGYPGNHTN